MSFRLALSIHLASPGDAAQMAADVRDLGYDGIDLVDGLDNRAAIPESAAAEIGHAIQNAGRRVACLTIGLSLDDLAAAANADELRGRIDVASQLGCDVVSIADASDALQRPPRWSGADAGRWLGPLADYAAERGVRIAIRNANWLHTAAPHWAMLNQIDHPSVGCDWDAWRAAAAGEEPAVSIPTLNSKIFVVHVPTHTLADPLSAARAMSLVTRLRGIGFGGFVCASVRRGTPRDAESALRAFLMRHSGRRRQVAQ